MSAFNSEHWPLIFWILYNWILKHLQFLVSDIYQYAIGQLFWNDTNFGSRTQHVLEHNSIGRPYIPNNCKQVGKPYIPNNGKQVGRPYIPNNGKQGC